ncbi:hypothetical protein EDD17DRAFT_1758519 [Pisolithus thermaeus]|nr:hypothetical protein EDD17DRAFT_1758519 [Pisolithus thermaeus]
MLCEGSTIKKCEVLEEHQFNLRTNVYVIGELKNRYSTDNTRASFTKLTRKVVFQLENQDGQYAMPGLQILGDHIILALFDWGGSISTHPLHIHQYPEAFLHVLLGITFSDAVVLGFDTMISPIEEGKKKVQIIRDGKECFVWVNQLLFISGLLHGRGTTVWSGVVTQANFPELEEGQKVGDPIYDFSSLAELLVGLIDCLKAHVNAFEIAGVLHQDISLFNLLLCVSVNGDEHRIDFLQSNILDNAEHTQLEEKIKA